MIATQQVLAAVFDWLTEPLGCFLFLAVLLVTLAQAINRPLHWWFHRKIIRLKYPTDQETQRAKEKERRQENWARGAMGITEVLTYYVVFVLAQAYVLGFFIGLLGVKTALGWKQQKLQEDPYLLLSAYMSLPLNLINLLLGIGAGWLFNYLTAG